MKYTALVILNYNNYEDTFSCIESVERFNTSPIKFIIVDNGSTRKDSVNIIDKYLKKRFFDSYQKIIVGNNYPSVLKYCSFLINPVNEGYANGNNQALKLIENDNTIENILILNNDVIFVEDIIPRLLQQKKELTDCAIISPALYVKDLTDYDYTCARKAPSAWDLILECLMLGLNINSYRKKIKNKYWLFINNPELKKSKLIEIEMPSGSCMLINKQLFKEIGYFDSHTFLYFEENILYAKIYGKGLKNYLMPQLKCIHLGAESTKRSKGYFIQKCGLESRCLYLEKYCNLTNKEKVIFFLAKRIQYFKIEILKLLKK